MQNPKNYRAPTSIPVSLTVMSNNETIQRRRRFRVTDRHVPSETTAIPVTPIIGGGSRNEYYFWYSNVLNKKITSPPPPPPLTKSHDFSVEVPQSPYGGGNLFIWKKTFIFSGTNFNQVRKNMKTRTSRSKSGRLCSSFDEKMAMNGKNSKGFWKDVRMPFRSRYIDSLNLPRPQDITSKIKMEIHL